jgi:1,4-alpha-glucan branching enzyme
VSYRVGRAAVLSLAAAQSRAPREENSMAITVQTDHRTNQAKVQLVLPDDVHDGPVSVVGTFNDWTPGRHRLVRRNNGTRSVTLKVPCTPGNELRFRYLGSGGRWFDDPEAHGFDDQGGIIRL